MPCRSPLRWCRALGHSRGLVAGITGAIGYGLGVVGARVWREFADRPVRPPRARSWRVFQIAGPVLLVVCYLFGQRRQGQIRDLVQAEPETFGSKLLMPLVAVLAFVGLVAAAPGYPALLLVGGRPGRPVRNAQPLRRRGQRHRDDLRPVHLTWPARPGFIDQPSIPSVSYLARHDVTVGRDTPTSSAIAVLLTPSAANKMILARCANPARIDDERVHSINRL